MKVATSEGWVPAVTNAGPLKLAIDGRLTVTTAVFTAESPAWLVTDSWKSVSD